MVIILYSYCNQIPFNNVELVDQKTNNQLIDSISLIYDNSDTYDNTFRYYDGVLYVDSRNLSSNKEFHNDSIVGKFLHYVDVFYISRKKEIVLQKKISDDIVSADYYSLTINGCMNGKEIANQKISIGEEGFDMKFDSYYIEFLHFLDEMLKEKRKRITKEQLKLWREGKIKL